MSLNILDYPFDAAALLQKRRALKAEWSARTDLTPKRVAILSGVTVGVFQDLLELWLLANGIRPTFYQGGYGLFYEQLVYDNSELKAFAPDVIYLHTSMRNIRQWPAADAPQAQAAALLADETAHFSQAAQAALTAQARADTLAADCAALPDDSSLTLLEGQAAALPGELSALTEKRSAAEEAAQTALQAKKALEQHPLYPAAEPELRQRSSPSWRP